MCGVSLILSVNSLRLKSTFGEISFGLLYAFLRLKFKIIFSSPLVC